MPRVPLVGLPADSKPIGLHRYQVVGEKYIHAVVRGADVVLGRSRSSGTVVRTYRV